MIKTSDVIQFFDRLAPGWDAEMVRNEEVIRTILDHAGVSEGKEILDVATGTGVLIPDYLKRRVGSVTAIDISPKMAEIAASKYTQPEVSILCGDAETTDFGKCFDCIMVYNAFPHFPDPDRLIRSLSAFLKPGGTLTIAHGMSREKIDAHHHGSARLVSNGLMSAESLAEIMGRYVSVETVISNDSMYQVVGKAR